MRLAILALLAGCASNEGKPDEPDASIDAPEAKVDAPEADAQVCWAYKLFTCMDTITEVCVPYHGCTLQSCNGMNYAYCGPG